LFKEFIMSKSLSLSRMGTAAALALSLAGFLAVVAEPAHARDRQATWSGANGKSATRDVHRANGDVSSTTTGANGKLLGSRNVDRSAEGAQATVTGPKGQSVSRNTTAQGNGDSATTVTGPNGQTAARTSQRAAQGGTISAGCRAAAGG
jgi:hypothetical protein